VLTRAQLLLGEHRVLLHATQQLRCYEEAANAVGRLSMRLELTEDLGVSLFLTLAQRPSLGDWSDAAMAVAACQRLSKVQELKGKYRDSPLVRFLDARFASGGSRGTPEDARQRLGYGLTPSPGAASPRDDQSGVAVELFSH
jgi:hypothetical protein